MKPTTAALVGAALCSSLAACGPGEPSTSIAPEWRMVLASPGGELAFGLTFEGAGAELAATVHNGEERIALGPVERSGERWTLRLAPYDSALEFTLAEDGRDLAGRWQKQLGGGETARLDLSGQAGEREALPGAAPSANERARLDGPWAVQFSSDEEIAVGHFECLPDGRARGTFETTLGDYRFLAGTFDGERLRLSCFDGGHAFLFDARLDEGGELSGDFWSRDSWHETWTARRDPDARLPDSFGLTTWTDAVPLAELTFPDLDGDRRSLADPAFGGAARLITLFGTWCPNCNDEAVFLSELHERYAARGLSILGLAFELDDDFERSKRQVERFTERHGVDYPVLIAGVADKAKASAAFPALDRVRAYPTAILLDAQDQVRAIHTGFSGPATGAAHEHMRERYEVLIEELLARPESR